MCCCNQSGNSSSEDFTIYGNQFTAPKEYANSFLKGRFRIYLRGVGFLTKNVEWQPITDGGFAILIPGWVVTNDIIINGQFY